MHLSAPMPVDPFQSPTPLGRTSHYHDDNTFLEDPPAAWDAPVASFIYTQPGGEPVQVHGYALDMDTGKVENVGSSFKKAISLARERSKLDIIDMPSLGPTAVLKDARDGAFKLVTMYTMDPSREEGDEVTGTPVIDTDAGPTKRAWPGYGRPTAVYPVGTDGGTTGPMDIQAAPLTPELWAIVGVDNIVNFHPEAR